MLVDVLSVGLGLSGVGAGPFLGSVTLIVYYLASFMLMSYSGSSSGPGLGVDPGGMRITINGAIAISIDGNATPCAAGSDSTGVTITGSSGGTVMVANMGSNSTVVAVASQGKIAKGITMAMEAMGRAPGAPGKLSFSGRSVAIDIKGSNVMAMGNNTRPCSTITGSIGVTAMSIGRGGIGVEKIGTKGAAVAIASGSGGAKAVGIAIG